MTQTINIRAIILWLLAAAMAIVLFVSLAHTHKVSAPTMQWQADSSWVKPWIFSTNE